MGDDWGAHGAGMRAMEAARKADKKYGITELKQENSRLKQELEELRQNVCDECSPDDYGWNYNRVEGRVPCVCITESGAYQELKSKLKELEYDDDIGNCHKCGGYLEVVDPSIYCPHCGKY